VSTDISEEHIASIFRVEEISSARSQQAIILLATCLLAELVPSILNSITNRTGNEYGIKQFLGLMYRVYSVSSDNIFRWICEVYCTHVLVCLATGP
jgi:uncharacterized protein (DUF1015 family)